MNRNLPITDIYAREIFDVQGDPAVEIEILAGKNTVGRASVSGGGFGSSSAEEAVECVNTRLAQEVIGMNVFDQESVDRVLIRADRKKGKSTIGASTLFGVSAAVAKAASGKLKVPLYRYLGGVRAKKLPALMARIPQMGKKNGLTGMKGFLIVPPRGIAFRENVRVYDRIFHIMRKQWETAGREMSGDDRKGGLSDLEYIKTVFRQTTEAAEAAGYCIGEDIMMALDASASQRYEAEKEGYLHIESNTGKKVQDIVGFYEKLLSEYPVCLLCDPLNDRECHGWGLLGRRPGGKVSLGIAGEASKSKQIETGAVNTVFIRPDQIGTLTEVSEIIQMARQSGCQTALSSCLAETEDGFLADIAVGFGLDLIQMETTYPCSQMAKINQFLRIEEALEK